MKWRIKSQVPHSTRSYPWHQRDEKRSSDWRTELDSMLSDQQVGEWPCHHSWHHGWHHGWHYGWHDVNPTGVTGDLSPWSWASCPPLLLTHADLIYNPDAYCMHRSVASYLSLALSSNHKSSKIHTGTFRLVMVQGEFWSGCLSVNNAWNIHAMGYLVINLRACGLCWCIYHGFWHGLVSQSGQCTFTVNHAKVAMASIQ